VKIIIGKLFPGGTRPMLVNVARYMVHASSSSYRSGRRGFSASHGSFYRGSTSRGAFGERRSRGERGIFLVNVICLL
jgi:hypothetical protein